GGLRLEGAGAMMWDESSYAETITADAACLPAPRGLRLGCPPFWGEGAGLGGCRHRGDCRRPHFFSPSQGSPPLRGGRPAAERRATPRARSPPSWPPPASAPAPPP